MSEGIVGLVWILTGAVFLGGVVAVVFVRDSPEQEAATAVRRSRRFTLARAEVSILVTLAAFAAAIWLHESFASWQAVTVVVGPVAAAALGLTVFALWPSTTIDGPVYRRMASLERRRPTDLVSRGLWRGFVVVSISTAALVTALGALSKSGPDGRALCFAAYSTCPSSYGPYLYPGWFFGVPALLCIGLTAAAVVGCLARIASAAAPAWRELTGVDAQLRRNSGRLVVLIGLTACLLTLAMFLFAAGIPLVNAPNLATGLPRQQEQVWAVAGFEALVFSLVILLAGLATGVAGIITAATAAKTVRRAFPRRRTAAA